MGDDLADSWATVVGRQYLEWFLKPYGQSSREFQGKENGLEKVISDRFQQLQGLPI